MGTVFLVAWNVVLRIQTTHCSVLDEICWLGEWK